MLRKILFWVGIAALLAAALGLWWAWRPITDTSLALELSPSQMTLPSAAGGLPAPGVPVARRVVLTYPSRLRLGESGLIRLTFAPLTDQGIPSPSMISDVSLTYNVLAEARLEVAVLSVGSYDHILLPLQANAPAVFEWHVPASQPGEYEGTAWLLLGFVPKEGGVTEERALSAQPVNLRVDALLGLGIVAVRVLAVCLLVVGLALVIFASLRRPQP